jgi:2-oxo-4-hydroxy-4-carboxy-5-ureidoimidazoline decarboxylase
MASLAEINAWSAERFRQELSRCCGSPHWVERMLDCRPFADEAALFQLAEEIWWSLEPKLWPEAFEHHPRIGGKDALRQKFAATRDWAQGEQSGVRGADEAVLDELARGNEEYEKKFGRIFIVCATGKTAAEMLALLKARLPNMNEEELYVTATEQAKINFVRLVKLLAKEAA